MRGQVTFRGNSGGAFSFIVLVPSDLWNAWRENGDVKEG